MLETFFKLKSKQMKKHQYPNLRILVFSNPLVVDKISKKFLYYKDSGFICTKNLIKSLPKNWRFDWVIPDKITDYKWFTEANKNVNLISYPYSTSIHQNRYEFYGNIFRKRFPYSTDVDVIINNQPETTPSLYTFFYNQKRDLPIIISYYHWIDCERSRKFASALGGYFWSQYEGFCKSNLNMFHSEYAFGLFENEVKNNLKKDIDDSCVEYFNPPPTIFGNEPISFPDKKIILFNHRLNKSTNWKLFLEASDKLYERRQDFVVWLTDDTKLSEFDYLNKPYIINKSVKNESYGYLIKNSKFSVCSHLGYSTWNMAVMDSIYNGCPVLLPSTKGDFYKSFFGEGDFYHNFLNLKDRLNYFLDNDLVEIQTRQYKIIQNIKPLNNIVVDVMQILRYRARKCAKYEDVYNYIMKKKECYKKDFVNEFWSFHVNSNFLPIRWKLLLEDNIIDNNINKETVYISI